MDRAGRAAALGSVWGRMDELRRRMTAEIQESLARTAGLDLTLPQSAALVRIVEGGALGVSELQAALGRSQSATSHLVTQLEIKGLVRRRADPRDGRRSALEPTKEGTALVRRVEAMRRRAFERLLDRVPPPVIRQLDQAMGALLDALDGHKPR